MAYRKLGHSTLTVSALGLGCMSMSGTYGRSDDGQAIAVTTGAHARGLLSKLVADAAPTELRGMAFVMLNPVRGAIVAGVIAGALRSTLGALAGAAFSAVAAAPVLALRPARPPAPPGRMA
jgi:hypothetical protein